MKTSSIRWPLTLTKSASTAVLPTVVAKKSRRSQSISTYQSRLWLIFLLLLLLLFVFVFFLLYETSSASSLPSLSPSTHYAVVIDAGSSGSRVYLYSYPDHSGDPHDLLQILPMVDEKGRFLVKKVTPGLSSFDREPHLAGVYLSPLLSFASSHIPQSQHAETPVFILATAGMRLLKRERKEAILMHLKMYIEDKFEFVVHERNLEVITGQEEGLYQWLAVNYVLGRFDHEHRGEEHRPGVQPQQDVHQEHPHATVGALDMGGASMQIAFELNADFDLAQLSGNKLDRDDMLEINLGCKEHDEEHTYKVLVKTFLGYGANQALQRHHRALFLSQINQRTSNTTIDELHGLSTDKRLEDPCNNVGFLDNVSMAIDVSRLNNASFPNTVFNKFSEPFTLFTVGTGNVEKCGSKLKKFVEQAEYSCNNKENCMSDGIQMKLWQQSSSSISEFYGFSEFWYSVHDVFEMTSPVYSSDDFLALTDNFCNLNWKGVHKDFVEKRKYANSDENRLKTQCFKANWMRIVIHDGLGFKNNNNVHKIVFASEESVRNGSIAHWTLGALLHRMRFYPLRAIESGGESIITHGPHHSAWDSFYLYTGHVVLGCVIFLTIASIGYCIRLKRFVRPRGLLRVSSMLRPKLKPDLEMGMRHSKSTSALHPLSHDIY